MGDRLGRYAFVLVVVCAANTSAQRLPRCQPELSAQQRQHGRSAFLFTCSEDGQRTRVWASELDGRGIRATRAIVRVNATTAVFSARVGVRQERAVLLVNGHRMRSADGRYQHTIDFDFDDVQRMLVVVGRNRFNIPWASLRGRTQPVVAATPSPVRSNYGSVSLAPGFLPDPHQVQGSSGGPTDATERSSACVGFITAVPDHLLTPTGNFNYLRVMVRSAADVTLVVQRPDGTYICNDDFEGTDPMVEGAFPTGTYRIWVGSYEQGTKTPYTLGFTELQAYTPARLPAR